MVFTQTSIRLRDLVAGVEGGRLLQGDPATSVRGISHDTRRLTPGEVFVAIPGFQHDALIFVPQALEKGASAIVAEAEPRSVPPDIPVLLVPSARRALGDLAAAFYRYPSRLLPVVGVTGTDGKTSTIHLLSAILEARGLVTGWLTTVNTKVGSDLRPNAAEHTTPEAPLVQRTLAELVEAGVQVALLETSSHALELERVRGTHYRVGVFTNLSPEHINFHGSLEAYREVKSRLFARLPEDGLAVLNADDPHVDAMRRATRARVLTYGLDQPADITAVEIRLGSDDTSFVLGGTCIQTHLVGRFNVSNWLAAYAAATAFGATPEHLRQAARDQPPVPGRMNLVRAEQPFAVVVDFAHTPQALEKALDALRSLTSGRVLLVFGLAGGRDSLNRPVMGRLAAAKTDFFVISMDDPGAEDPARIAEQIAEGARGAGAVPERDFAIDLDRRSAIRCVLERARPGDVVLLAGKGHENRMVIGDERVAWNDSRVAQEELGRLGWGGTAQPVP
jgi:UDP-N-acetylmuramoyl-L-alanyl-D-glutamate--2,6-diaminopimelate ligase